LVYLAKLGFEKLVLNNGPQPTNPTTAILSLFDGLSSDFIRRVLFAGLVI
jgi:hypothetical protein